MILSKYFIENKNHSLVNTENIWCFCRMGQDEDDMIVTTKIAKLFGSIKHVPIKQIPKGNWYFSECKKLNKSREKKLDILLAYFKPIVHFYTLRKYHKTTCFFCFFLFSENSCRNETLLKIG